VSCCAKDTIRRAIPVLCSLQADALFISFVVKKIEVNKDFDASIFDMPKN
jgi:hypothetical protein